MRQIDGSLASMQEVVGGYIETVRLGVPPGGDPSRMFVMVVNEDGRLKGLPDNLVLGNQIIVGTVFIAIMTPTDIVGLKKDEVAAWDNLGDPNLIRL